MTASPCGGCISEQSRPGEGDRARPRRRSRGGGAAGLGDQARAGGAVARDLSRRQGLGAPPRRHRAALPRAAAARTEGACRQPALRRADGWCTRCCSICRRSQPPIGGRGARFRRRTRARPAAEMREEIVSETLAIVQDARFAPLFAARQPQRGAGGGKARRGRRCARTPARSIGWRSSTTPCSCSTTRRIGRRLPSPDEVAPGYIAQLAAYRAALRLMFPERALRAAITLDRRPETHGNPINTA